MNSRALYDEGLIDARGVVIAALLSDGWTREEAKALCHEVLDPKKDPMRWKHWADDEVAVLAEALGDPMVLPPAEEIRDLAEKFGRTVKSTKSRMERMIAAAGSGGVDRDHNDPG